MAEQNFKILVLFYSWSGHTARFAEHIANGAKMVSGAQVEIKRVPEVVSQEVIGRHPEISEGQSFINQFPIATAEDLTSADGIAFGTPVHFGSFASQLKQFIDQLTPVFIKGMMVGKPASCFVSAGSLHGGEEAALLSLMIPLLNLGMIPVGVPYPIQGTGPEFDAGSPYGAIFVSGHMGEKKISSDDIKIAEVLGKRLSAMTKVLKIGCANSSECALVLSTKH